MAGVQGKIAIVTGGADGMGAATCRIFAERGATVVVTDVKEELGAKVAAEIDGGSVFKKLNVASEQDWIELVAFTMEKFGRIDALVNNAGIIHFCDIENMAEADFDRVLAVNVKGPMLGMKHVGKVMKKAGKGAIVNISSIDGYRGPNALGAYVASKWALRGLTKTAATEYGPYGVRVNSVHPGGVNTVMGNPMNKGANTVDEDYELVPLQRVGAPREIGEASVFLCSDEASYITGAELLVDGGWKSAVYHKGLPGYPPAR
jgi:3alpha(or 20beta)-hydroxysteroid dehydrogenase